jgi:hypothetical protein
MREKTREVVVKNDNMLSIQQLQLFKRVPMASEQVPVRPKGVGVRAELVPVRTQQVLMRYISA